ncbi:hypothetical protein [Candidatus Ichthyocystis hellenicum]|uniref:hypothetical protein n=1 Tax=Candidatus Ichthyocystis hellenicum TaxID=1561003 RepID=UPI0011125B75|nr:hypothetical protein [Candidatus Ichthyocystis hellenicum]
MTCSRVEHSEYGMCSPNMASLALMFFEIGEIFPSARNGFWVLITTEKKVLIVAEENCQIREQ